MFVPRNSQTSRLVPVAKGNNLSFDFAVLVAPKSNMNDYPTLHTMVKDAQRDSPHEVRHLFIRSMGRVAKC